MLVIITDVWIIARQSLGCSSLNAKKKVVKPTVPKHARINNNFLCFTGPKGWACLHFIIVIIKQK